jgi:thiamine biosynthesis lipoprotein
MIIERFPAMGTTFEVHAADRSAIDRCRHLVDAAEQRFSRFVPDSELSRINREGERTVSPDMRSILTEAAELQRRTGGTFDIGVGSSVIGWGYDTTFADVVDRAEPLGYPASSAWRLRGDVVTLEAGTRIDLGGIAKGWIADRLVEDGHATVASAGGDLRSVDATLVVDVLDHEGSVAAAVPVGIGALATSSRSQRTWMVADQRVHHLVDPRSLRPADTPILSASAVAATATEAEAAAKAILVMGVDGLAWADGQPWIRDAIAVWHDGNVYGTSRRMAS